MEAQSNDAAFVLLTEPQYQVIFAIGLISSLLSCFGSISVAYLVKGRANAFERIMLGICVADLLSTTANMLQLFLLPSYTRLPYARGSESTCQFTGFLFYSCLASAVYSTGLTYYFWSSVKENHTTQQGAKLSLEPWIHIVPWIVMALISIIAISMDTIHPSIVLGICLVSCPIDPVTWECTRRDTFALVLRISATTIIVATAIIAIYYLFRIHRHVRHQVEINLQYDFASDTNNNNDGETKSAPRSSSLLKATMRQAVSYSLACLNTSAAVMSAVVGKEVLYDRFGINNSLVYFCLAVYVYAMFPLQGFLNWLVFVRPRVVRWKEAYPENRYFWCMLQTVLDRSTPKPTTPRTLSFDLEQR